MGILDFCGIGAMRFCKIAMRGAALDFLGFCGMGAMCFCKIAMRQFLISISTLFFYRLCRNGKEKISSAPHLYLAKLFISNAANGIQ